MPTPPHLTGRRARTGPPPRSPADLRRRGLTWGGLCGLLGLGSAPARAGLPEVVARQKPGVVAIGTYSPLTSPRFQFRGTGFAVGDGLTLITNVHVLPGHEPRPLAAPAPAPNPPPDDTGRPTAPLADSGRLPPQLSLYVPGTHKGSQDPGDIRPLRVVALDPEHDIAVLRCDGAPLPTLKLAEPTLPREGQAVALIGFPIGSALGFSHVTHAGIVSAVTPIVLPQATASQLSAAAVARVRQGPFEILQLDAIAYPGNSGGPLLDAETGEVLGVMNMVFVRGSRESALSAPTGISYAVPVRWVHALLARR